MFPAGPPGAGLIILRLCATAMVVGYALGVGGKVPNWVFLVLWPVAGFLVAGLMTPFACAAALVLQITVAWVTGFRVLPCCVLGVLLLVVVLLLGPGAYSLDALWFGRRKVTVSRD